MNNIDATIFVYHKDNKIKCLSFENLKDHNQLILNGYTHTATINPCLFIENLFNNDVDIINEIKLLSKI